MTIGVPAYLSCQRPNLSCVPSTCQRPAPSVHTHRSVCPRTRIGRVSETSSSKTAPPPSASWRAYIARAPARRDASCPIPLTGAVGAAVPCAQSRTEDATNLRRRPYRAPRSTATVSGYRHRWAPQRRGCLPDKKALAACRGPRAAGDDSAPDEPSRRFSLSTGPPFPARACLPVNDRIGDAEEKGKEEEAAAAGKSSGLLPITVPGVAEPAGPRTPVRQAFLRRRALCFCRATTATPHLCSSAGETRCLGNVPSRVTRNR